MSSHVVWANKGGIGKSTLTFQLACSSAENNPTKKVYVIDLSPQCDVSRMILGGGHNSGEDKILDLMRSIPRKTVQTYLLDCLNDVPSGIGWPSSAQYIIKPNEIRNQDAQQLPENIRLLSGDFDLERTIQLIDQLPQPPKRTGRAPTGPEYSTFLLTRSFIRKIIEDLEDQQDNIVIIDTDPYFNVITTHMGLLGADRWTSAYSPSSQASQYAVLRSIEFMFDNTSGLKEIVEEEKRRYPKPWFDNRGNELEVPEIDVSRPYLLVGNMVTPYRLSGNQGYTDPQRLHRQTIEYMQEAAREEAEKYEVRNFDRHEHMWDMRRLGLICDYNGLMLSSLQLGSNYPEPASLRRYHLNRTGGTPGQLEGYSSRLSEISSLL